MKTRKSVSKSLLAVLLWIALPLHTEAGLGHKMLLMGIQLPPGFSIDLYSAGVPGARSMALSPSGIVYVGTRQEGAVYALVDRTGDGKADQVLTLARRLNMPNGVALWEKDLYVAETGRILRFPGIEARLENPPAPHVVTDRYPDDQRHGARYIRFGPDGRLYIAVGAPCNVCRKNDPIFASITRIQPDGSGFEIFAHGIRNSLGFDWHPGTGDLWFTDIGRERLGDHKPPDELNRAYLKGLHFGFPYCHGGIIADPDYGSSRSCAQFTMPAAALAPHAAAQGMLFYTGSMFPEAYRNQIFIAEHGSSDRKEKAGFRIMLVRLEGDRMVSYEPFATGWLMGDSFWGRPVDIQQMPDGSLLVSDDHRGAVYRITYSPE
jgi:glucose/arabinose dehydrogenase